MNMASLWSLPMLFVCENNGYAMSPPVARISASGEISKRASAYNMESRVCNGFDVEETYFTAFEMIKEVRESHKPQLLEVMTYRHCGHSRNDSRIYRSREEEKEMMDRDCIEAARNELISRGVSETDVAAVERAVCEEIEAAAEYALKEPVSSTEKAYSGLFA